MKIRGIVTTTVLTLALIIISTTTVAALSCSDGDICVNESGWWRDGGTLNASGAPIQTAVDNATAGETICVAAGSYTENVNITTPHLTLQGEGAGVVIVNAADPDNHVFEVTADYVNILGFNATGVTGFSYAGIHLGDVDHCNISENTASNNNYGIRLSSSSNNTLTNNTAKSNNNYGIFLRYSSNYNTLVNNTALNNDNGIDLYSSSNNTLIGNNCSSNHIGIYLGYSSNYNTLTNNTANSNNIYGIHLSYSSNYNTLTNNTALNNNYGIDLYSSSNNNTLANNTLANNMRGIYLHSSNNNTLTNNTVNLNSNNGIHLYSSSNNTLANNTASNNKFGISLDSSSNNTLMSNTANLNGDYGIYLLSSSNNTFTNNTANLNGNNGIHLYSSSNNTLASNTASSNDYGGIHLYSSSNNTASNNTASNNMRGIYLHSSNNNTLTNNTVNLNSDHGIYLYSSSNNTLTSNIANSNSNNGIYLYSSSNYNMLASNTANSNNYDGICLSSSSSNTLTNNTASSNNNRGIYLSSSSDNLIYNNYFNNTNNAYDNTGSNIWNATKTNGTNIIGGPFLGGNYWSDYAGVDNDSDGLGDTLTPYNSSDDIKNGGDYHPLVILDNTPPPSIMYLKNITYAQTYINWTWTNPSDPDFNHTELYLNGTFLTNILAPQNYYNATGLLPDTSYELGTRTVDTSGNINLTWVNDTASTLPASGTTLNLYTGWNLISLPLMPEDTSITSLLSPINGNYSIVWAYNASDIADHWKKYDPAAPFGNDLTTMEAGKGYWIMMISDDTLLISGTVPESTDINLPTGWNLIGYNSLDNQPIAEALSSISGNYSIGWAYDASDTADYWKKYDPVAPFGNDLEIMEPGKSYWIMMTSDDILEI